MKLIKQSLFSVTFTRIAWDDRYFYIEAENMEDALSLVKELKKTDYKEWTLKTINYIGMCYKQSTKTITVEV